MGLGMHRIRIEEVVQLLLLHGSKGYSLRLMQLLWVKFWWLDAISLDYNSLLLLIKVLPHHPLDLLKW